MQMEESWKIATNTRYNGEASNVLSEKLVTTILMICVMWMQKGELRSVLMVLKGVIILDVKHEVEMKES